MCTARPSGFSSRLIDKYPMIPHHSSVPNFVPFTRRRYRCSDFGCQKTNKIPLHPIYPVHGKVFLEKTPVTFPEPGNLILTVK